MSGPVAAGTWPVGAAGPDRTGRRPAQAASLEFPGAGAAAIGVASPTTRGRAGVVAEKKPWFGRNRTGLGYHPTSWQGWAVVLVVVAAIVLVRWLVVR